MAEKKRRKFNVCRNCEYRFQGIDNYCPSCGQENHNLNVPFSHVILEVLEGTLHFDTKIFRTLKLLLFKPGLLTKLFAENKRASFVPPIRLYVFISFIFFLMLSADILKRGGKNQTVKTAILTNEGLKVGTQEVQGPVEFNVGGIDSEDLKKVSQANDASLDSVLKRNGFEQTGFNRAGIRKVSKFLASGKEEQTHKFLKMLSLLMFLLMPVFGLILKSAYFRHNSRYIQHLVFSVHYHCFVFIALILILLLDFFTDWGGFAVVSWVIIVGYLFLALHRLYQQRIGKTLLKTIYVAGFYFVTLSIFFLLGLILSVAFA